ncbi:hypothetical protein F5H01DRAFT_351342 [Linnemannia elongata]|nr:hypothetical protein F5H01DRAFT_351342 [Linnemannia elongata]
MDRRGCSPFSTTSSRICSRWEVVADCVFARDGKTRKRKERVGLLLLTRCCSCFVRVLLLQVSNLGVFCISSLFVLHIMSVYCYPIRLFAKQ